MTRFVFCHSIHKIVLAEIDIIFDTLKEYIIWFCYEHTILYEWIILMDWKKEIIDNIIEIQCETKHEGHTTLCIQDNNTKKTLHIPFSSYMTYRDLRIIFSLFLPNTEWLFYLIMNGTYYQPKDDMIFIPNDCKECVIDDSVYPFTATFTKKKNK